MASPPIKRALISVSDKLGLAEFARGLAAAGVELFSTGGTRTLSGSRGARRSATWPSTPAFPKCSTAG